MKIKTKMLIIAKDDYPLEICNIKGKPIRNFLHYWLKRLIHGSHKECKKCYEERKGIKVK